LLKNEMTDLIVIQNVPDRVARGEVNKIEKEIKWELAHEGQNIVVR